MKEQLTRTPFEHMDAITEAFYQILVGCLGDEFAFDYAQIAMLKAIWRFIYATEKQTNYPEPGATELPKNIARLRRMVGDKGRIQ